MREPIRFLFEKSPEGRGTANGWDNQEKELRCLCNLTAALQCMCTRVIRAKAYPTRLLA